MENEIYICTKCGQPHEDWPALAYSSPDNYASLSQEDKNEIAELSNDICIINYGDQTDRFIRTTLFQKVNDYCEDLNYGLWVSLSEKSFADYTENFDNQDHEVKYFGWLCNDIPGYEFEESIPMTVFTKKGNDRPEIVPHLDFNHPFVADYYNGITKDEAEKRIRDMINTITENP